MFHFINNRASMFCKRPSQRLIVIAFACTVGAALTGAGCASARKSEIPESRFQADAKLAEGRLVFMHTCNQCHVLGGPGLGPGINDKPLPAFAIKMQVRKGVGTMPAFGPYDISDEQLDAVVDYLQTLRKQEGPLASR
jgi:mono/diheme cytochrome c family protein